MFLHGGDKGLFAQHIEAVFQKILRYREVEIAGKRIDDKVNILSAEYLFIIRINITAVLFFRTFAADIHLVDNGDDFEAFGILFQVKAVDIAAAPALTEYGYTNLFHFTLLYFRVIYTLIIPCRRRK